MLDLISNSSRSPLPGMGLVDLKDWIGQNPNVDLLLLSKKLPWEELIQTVHDTCGYSEDQGRKTIPIRAQLGLQLIKYYYGFSDSQTLNFFIHSHYAQMFCGYSTLQVKAPCTTQNMCQFRKRFNEESIKKILSSTLKAANIKEDNCKDIIVDSSCFEKNIRFPSEEKLRERAISRIEKLAKKNYIKFRRTYEKELNKLYRTIRFNYKSKKESDKVSAAKYRVQIILGYLIRDFERKYIAKIEEINKSKNKQLNLCDTDKGNTTEDKSIDPVLEEINLYKKVQQQDFKTKHKCYSLHEPQTDAVKKNKRGMPFEFGKKVAIALSNNGFIIGVNVFKNNPNDAKTTEEIVLGAESITGYAVNEVIGDRGYNPKNGNFNLCGGRVTLSIPESGNAKAPEEKKKNRIKFGRRAGIEPIFEHIKDEHRARRNFLHGWAGDVFNGFMSCIGFNLKKIVNNLSTA